MPEEHGTCGGLMSEFIRDIRRLTRGAMSKKSAKFLARLLLLSILPPVAGCASHQTGPTRAISIEEDVASIRPLALMTEDNLATFYQLKPAQQASLRNQIITARMYLADIEYNYYEARLTKELQDEGFAATAANLGLTGTAALIPVAQTSRLLAGIATGVTGLDKAYSEKELLNNTIQALQTQMRADRKTQAAAIYSKMFVSSSGSSMTLTPIDQYTLPMALSDTDRYYQAGTMSSALIGLTKTVSNAEQNADNAKDQAGPNASQVTSVKAIAAPLPTNQTTTTPARPLIKSNQQISALGPVSNPMPTAFGNVEKRTISASEVPAMLQALCVSQASTTNDFGPLNSQARIAIAKFKAGVRNDSAVPQDNEIINKKSQADQSIANLHDLNKLRQAVNLYVHDKDPNWCSGPNAAFLVGKKVR